MELSVGEKIVIFRGFLRTLQDANKEKCVQICLAIISLEVT